MPIEKSRDKLFLPEKGTKGCILFKHHVQGKVFDSNYIEMGVKAVKMH